MSGPFSAQAVWIGADSIARKKYTPYRFIAVAFVERLSCSDLASGTIYDRFRIWTESIGQLCGRDCQSDEFEE